MGSDIPDWLRSEEYYRPLKGKDSFIKKSLNKIVTVLNDYRLNSNIGVSYIDAPMKLLLVLTLIILMACSHNMFFTYIVGVSLAVRICFLNGEVIKNIIITAFGAFLLSAFILFPSIFLGSPKTFALISIKVFISVCMLRTLALTTKWNELTASLKIIYIPNIIILTLDLAIKYIELLSRICNNLFIALKLRSVGRNSQKSTSFAGIMGVTFLRSKEMSEETYQAMLCRCFTGNYTRHFKFKHKIYDLICIKIILLFIALFIYLESLM